MPIFKLCAVSRSLPTDQGTASASASATLQGQSVAPVLLHEACNGGQKGQQLMLVGLGKAQTTATWGENGFHVSTNSSHCHVPAFGPTRLLCILKPRMPQQQY